MNVRAKYKLIIIIPGVGGHSQTFYVKLFAKHFVTRGSFQHENYIVAVLQARGAGNNPLLTEKLHEFP